MKMIKRRKLAVKGGLGVLVLLGGVGFGGINEARAATCGPKDVRWASSSNRVYVTGDVTCTLSDLAVLEPHAGIKPVEGQEHTWLLGSNVVLKGGARLDLVGSGLGGDVDELRLKSNNNGEANSIVYIRAHWGEINIKGTKIISWDESAGGPDTEYGTYGRSYIQARSYLDGSEARESRLDIIDSEIGHLGYYGAEAYGLSWKVLGKTKGIYDQVNVYGDVTGSHIHHNYFGAYTYGAQDMNWLNNEIDNNVVYGLDPHDDSDRLVIKNNSVHDNGYHGIIGSRRCDHLVISDNESYGNGGNGIMLHRHTDEAVVENNKVYGNGDSGIAVFDSHRNVIRNNFLEGNEKGMRFSVGSSDNIVEGNQVLNSTKYGFYFYKGSDLPATGDGRLRRNVFEGNNVKGSGINGIKLGEGEENVFTNNDFENNGKDIVLIDAHRNRLESNRVSGNKMYGIRLKVGSTGNAVIGNSIKNNGKVGVYLWDKSNNNEVRENYVSGHYHYGIRLIDCSNNVIRDNQIENNKRGINFNSGSGANMVVGNAINDNEQYPVYLQVSDGNVFKANETTGNGRNYYYAKSKSITTIMDTPVLVVKAGDMDSKMIIEDDNNGVFDNEREIPTVVNEEGSTVVLTRDITGAPVDFRLADFQVTPSGGSASVVLYSVWGEGAPEWTAQSQSGAINVGYRMGGLQAGDTYVIEKDGEFILSVEADDKGMIEFRDDLVDEKVARFRISLAATPLGEEEIEYK